MNQKQEKLLVEHETVNERDAVVVGLATQIYVASLGRLAPIMCFTKAEEFAVSLRDRGEARLKAQQAEVDALADLPCPTCGSKMHLLCLCYGCGNIPPNHSVLCPMNGPQVRR